MEKILVTVKQKKLVEKLKRKYQYEKDSTVFQMILDTHGDSWKL